MDLNKAVVNFLLECPVIKNNPLYFNAINAEDNSKQVITVSDSREINKPYIDGSVMKRYTFTIVDFRSVVYQPIVKTPTGGLDETKPNENMSEMLDVQSLIDWISSKDEKREFPDFGTDCMVERVVATTNTPTLNGIDRSVTPALAKYSITIQVDYLDNSKKIWR